MNHEIEFALSQSDDGYNVCDWFDGGWYTIEEAREAATVDEADKILREAYKGPDIDGVTCSWRFA